MKNIDWIKVKAERRIKLIAVKQCEMESYILISKLPDVSIVSTYDMPENWMVGGVQYDFGRNTFLFAILSPEFYPVSGSAQFPEMSADQKVIKVTRERVNGGQCIEKPDRIKWG